MNKLEQLKDFIQNHNGETIGRFTFHYYEKPDWEYYYIQVDMFNNGLSCKCTFYLNHKNTPYLGENLELLGNNNNLIKNHYENLMQQLDKIFLKIKLESKLTEKHKQGVRKI